MDELRLTKRHVLDSLVSLTTTGELVFYVDGVKYELPVESLLAYAEHELDLLDDKVDKARASAEKKKIAGEELEQVVYDALTNEFQTVAEIVERISDPAVTAQKAVYRLSQLYKTGEIEKSSITIPAKKGYKARTFATYRKRGL